MRWETVTGRQWLRLSEKRHSPSCEVQTEPSQAPQSCPDPQLTALSSQLVHPVLSPPWIRNRKDVPAVCVLLPPGAC